ncbi:MAG: hypothetical protein ACHQ4G_02420 [Opitutales bacterium]
MKAPTFAERYCTKNAIPASEFERHLLRRVLYPHARLLAPILLVLHSEYLAADHDFIRGVERLTLYHEFFSASVDYVHHPANRGFLRRQCKIRISSDRLRRIVRATLQPEAAAADDDQDPRHETPRP